ncbi:energy transducer TonB [Paludibacterium sp. B53371]|uniref:energy transducer TonB n=1 Tax=Paludibacterium sp. B53371 TaxID=2806263 RepID=UPI001C042551|nr:energy transducer TonB [Paludibacterium sp. B53371]
MPSAPHHTHHLTRAWPLLTALLLSAAVHLLLMLLPGVPAHSPRFTQTIPLQLTLQPPPPATTGDMGTPPAAAMAMQPADTPPAATGKPQTRHLRQLAAKPQPAPIAQAVAPQLAPPAAKGVSVASLLSQISTEAGNTSPQTPPPGRLVYGSSARGYMWRQYMDDWAGKMERIGALNYPQEARNQGLTGGPTLSVVINADGTLAALSISRSSGNQILDEAAQRIVRLAAPFAPFPPELAAQARSLEIRRKWHFTTGNELSVQ